MRLSKKPKLTLGLAFGILALIAIAGAVSLAIPSRNGYRGNLMTVKVFYANDKLDPELTCTKVFPVERSVPKSSAVASAALAELLKGPTASEKSEGYYTSINPGVRVNKIRITSSTAHADFSEELQKEIGGSCRVAAIRAEISETLKQFPTVSEVIISVEGDSETALQP